MKPKHPMQPIIRAPDGVIRFQGNSIIHWMLEQGREGRRFTLNDVAATGFDNEDHRQLAQLLGYSVSGYCGLPYVDDESAQAASEAAGR